MIDWPFIIGYVAIGSVALFLQYKSNIAALDRLAEAHQQNVTDLRRTIDLLKMEIDAAPRVAPAREARRFDDAEQA